MSSLVAIGVTSSPTRSFPSPHQSSFATWDINSSDMEFQNIFAPEFKTLMSQFLVKMLDTKLNEQVFSVHLKSKCLFLL